MGVQKLQFHVDDKMLETRGFLTILHQRMEKSTDEFDSDLLKHLILKLTAGITLLSMEQGPGDVAGRNVDILRIIPPTLMHKLWRLLGKGDAIATAFQRELARGLNGNNRSALF